jgi:hypothetical protein
MNPNSQCANVPELLSQVAEDQALSPDRGAIFNTKVNLQAATATSRRCSPTWDSSIAGSLLL